MRTLLLFIFVFAVAAATAQDAKRQLQEGLFEEQVNRDLEAAMKHYEALLQPYDEQRTWAATAVFRLGECYRKLGRTNEMVTQFERVITEFSDQTNLVESARGYLQGRGLRPISIPGASATNLLTRTETDLAKVMRMVRDSPDLLRTSSVDQPNPMATAIKKGDIPVVKFLLEAGVSGPSNLQYAVSSGNLAITQLLLPSVVNEQESLNQALVAAVEKDFLGLAEFLLENKASPDAVEPTDGNVLNRAISRGQMEMAKLLIAQGADVNASTPDGNTLLGFLSKSMEADYLPFAKLLLDHGADPNKLDERGAAPLHLAATWPEMITLLLEHGADSKIWTRKPDYKFRFTPLHLAGTKKTGARNLEAMKLLIDAGADVNAQYEGGPTPLLSLWYDPEPEWIELLLERGADPNRKGRSESSSFTGPITSLVNAGFAGTFTEARTEVIDLLLAAGADPNFVIPCVPPKTLLQHTFSTSGPGRPAPTGRSREPIVLKHEIFARLVMAGANPDLAPEEWIFLRSVDAGQRLPELWELLPQMIKNGADVNRAREGFSPLMAAVSRRATNIVQILLDAGANANHKNQEGRTALDQVFSTLQSESLKADRRVFETMRRQLLEAGASYVSGRDDAITFLRKDSGYKTTVLLREKQRHSSFHLLEIVALAFDGPMVPGFSFPDFTDVRVHRPTTNGYRGESYDITRLLTDTNAPPVPLNWGDVLEWKTLPHPVGASWELPFEMRDQFARRLARKVILKYADEPQTRLLTPLHSRPFVEEIGTNAVLVTDCWLTETLKSVDDYLSTYDLSRVVVERRDRDGKLKRWLFDASGTGNARSEFQRSSLWLRDGDVIVIPHRNDKVDVPGYPIEIEGPLARAFPGRVIRTLPPPIRR